MPPIHGNERPLVVIGAGAAGMASAISAARSGVGVILVDESPRVGGTVAYSLIHTIGGLFDSSGQFINNGLPIELASRLRREKPSVRNRRIGSVWTLSVPPAHYQRVVEDWISEESSIQVLCDTALVSARSSNGSIDALEVQGRTGERYSLFPRAVIDASGSAAVIRQLDPTCILDEPDRAAAGLIVRLGGVKAGTLAFPASVAVMRRMKDAVKSGELPSSCRHAWLDMGVADDDAYLKLCVPIERELPTNQHMVQYLAEAEDARDSVLSFLRSVPGFESVAVLETGRLGIRDGGRIRGEYQLTGEDVRQQRQFADAICRSCWPIEFWDCKRGVQLEYLPAGAYYEIPMRSLRLPQITNLWVAGKCLSADRLAHASARVAGTCWAMGEAVGRSSARYCLANQE